MKTYILNIPSLSITFKGDAIAITNKIADSCNPFLNRINLLTEVMLSNNVMITEQGITCSVKAV